MRKATPPRREIMLRVRAPGLVHFLVSGSSLLTPTALMINAIRPARNVSLYVVSILWAEYNQWEC